MLKGEATGRLLRAFSFHVALSRTDGGSPEVLTNGGFSECSGLGAEADLKELLQGGLNDRVTRLIGRVRLQPIVLKRGMFAPKDGGPVSTELWDWFTDVIAGVYPVRRYDGVITVMPPLGEDPMAVWTFRRGLPVKIVGPTLDARTGEVAIEELHIAHEGLSLQRSSGGR